MLAVGPQYSLLKMWTMTVQKVLKQGLNKSNLQHVEKTSSHVMMGSALIWNKGATRFLIVWTSLMKMTVLPLW